MILFLSLFFNSHVCHFSFVGWILCVIECYFYITLLAFSPIPPPPPKSLGGTYKILLSLSY